MFQDLCPDQLGGEVRWTGEGYLPRVSSYSAPWRKRVSSSPRVSQRAANAQKSSHQTRQCQVYFALAPSGIGRSLLGQGLIGTTSLIIPQASLHLDA